MAAINLQRSLEGHGGHRRVWGGPARPPHPHEATDTFDSEMQEWEDQLHDMQRKIEELYNEVQARRGGSDGAGGGDNNTDNNNPKNGVVGAEFGLVGGGHNGSAFFPGEGSGSPGVATTGATAVPNHHHHANGRSRHHHHGHGGHGSAPSGRRQNNGGYGGSGCCHDDAVSQIYGDLLQDYLGQAKGTDQRNNNSSGRARRVHFDQTVKVSQDLPGYQEETNRWPDIQRTSQEHFPGGCEDAENRKNRVAHGKSHAGKESSPNKENNSNSNKPPLRQRDAFTTGGPPPPPPQRSQLPNAPPSSSSSDSPAKSFGPGALAADRKCGGSPSVLRKFGAMLQENEGKTLTDSGVVTTTAASAQQQQSPSCQRRGGGGLAAAAAAAAAMAPAGRADVLAAAAAALLLLEQEQRAAPLTDSPGRLNTEQQQPNKAPHHHQPSGPPPPLLQSQRRAQQHGTAALAGSPKLRPRANSGAGERGDAAAESRTRRSAGQPAAEPRALHQDNYRVLNSSSSSSQRMQRSAPPATAGQSSPRGGRDDGLIALLDMLDIQHEYGSSSSSSSSACPRGGQASHRLETAQQQGVPDESSSPSASRKCFSRPSRPANQRPPSRWAGRAPDSSSSSNPGPMYRPPSPLARPPSPVTPSPGSARKQQAPLAVSYRLHTETVIM